MAAEIDEDMVRTKKYVLVMDSYAGADRLMRFSGCIASWGLPLLQAPYDNEKLAIRRTFFRTIHPKYTFIISRMMRSRMIY